jgi:small subunit ribosomal protein S5e
MAEVAEETIPMEEPTEELVADEAAEEEDFVAAGGATEVKLFGKWSFDDIEVRDISLEVSYGW